MAAPAIVSEVITSKQEMTEMRVRTFPLLVAAFAISGAGVTRIADEPKTVAGVLAADDDWLAAELRGDAAALARRLADGYRDIEPNGRAHPKAELVDRTSKRQNPETGTAASVARAFRRAHPILQDVQIFGDTAVVSFRSVDPNASSIVRSTDVFAYEGGIWRGVMSQHSAVANGS